MSVLSAETLKKRVTEGWIFRVETFDDNKLWAGKYNLRMADDCMVIPDAGVPGGKKYKKGEFRDGVPVVLAPGETALISTREKLCVPWDMSGIVGPKFSLARKGLLVLTGTVVDPGFGLIKNGDEWVPRDDERLHFLVANLSRSERFLLPGTTRIAAVQFFNLDQTVEGHYAERAVESTRDLYTEFFDGEALADAGLAFIHEFASLRKSVDGDIAAVQTSVSTRLDQVENDLRVVSGQFETLQHGTNQLIYFGVFLLAVTLLAACITLGVGFFGTAHLGWARAVTILGLSGMATFLIWNKVKDFADRQSRGGSS